MKLFCVYSSWLNLVVFSLFFVIQIYDIKYCWQPSSSSSSLSLAFEELRSFFCVFGVAHKEAKG
jgi:hypothetical protein